MGSASSKQQSPQTRKDCGMLASTTESTISTNSTDPKIYSAVKDILLEPATVKAMLRENYENKSLLGKGSFGEVYLVQHRKTKEMYACKILKKSQNFLTLQTEIQILSSTNHCNIIRLHELYETHDKVWMILEYADGKDLVNALAALPKYSERAIAQLFRQILLAVQYLHTKGVVHRDLKLDNLLYTFPAAKEETVKDNEAEESIELQVKIADFGLSAVLSSRSSSSTYFTSSTSSSSEKNKRKQMKQNKELREMWGTIEYFAPEVFSRAYGSQADVWALGCILHEMLTGRLAFPRPEKPSPITNLLKQKVFQQEKPLRSFEKRSTFQSLSPAAKEFMKGMLKRKANQRWDIEECLQHPWITGEGLTEESLALYDQELLRVKQVMFDRSVKRMMLTRL